MVKVVSGRVNRERNETEVVHILDSVSVLILQHHHSSMKHLPQLLIEHFHTSSPASYEANFLIEQLSTLNSSIFTLQLQAMTPWI